MQAASYTSALVKPIQNAVDLKKIWLIKFVVGHGLPLKKEQHKEEQESKQRKS